MENIISKILVSVQSMQQQINDLSSIKSVAWVPPRPNIETTISGERPGWGRTTVPHVTREDIQWLRRIPEADLPWKPKVDKNLDSKDKGKNKK
jgi:hypothetical protein